MDFLKNKNIYLGISEREAGPMLLGSSHEKRLSFFKKNGLDNKIVISARLVHENRVAIIDYINENQIIPDCDALITNQNKYLLTVTVADCLPIYFYDRNKRVVAIAHAGWRGVVSKIANEVIEKFISYYGSELGDIEIFIGPHIHDCHFEVKKDVADEFNSSDQIIRDEKIYINLGKIVTEQLIESGILNTSINISSECTYCVSDKYYSFRRDKPKEKEVMIAYIGLK